jgi:hypothetical protein
MWPFNAPKQETAVEQLQSFENKREEVLITIHNQLTSIQPFFSAEANYSQPGVMPHAAIILRELQQLRKLTTEATFSKELRDDFLAATGKYISTKNTTKHTLIQEYLFRISEMQTAVQSILNANQQFELKKGSYFVAEHHWEFLHDAVQAGEAKVLDEKKKTETYARIQNRAA